MKRKGKKKKRGNSRLEGSKKHEKLSALMLKPNLEADFIKNIPEEKRN